MFTQPPVYIGINSKLIKLGKNGNNSTLFIPFARIDTNSSSFVDK